MPDGYSRYTKIEPGDEAVSRPSPSSRYTKIEPGDETPAQPAPAPPPVPSLADTVTVDPNTFLPIQVPSQAPPEPPVAPPPDGGRQPVNIDPASFLPVPAAPVAAPEAPAPETPTQSLADAIAGSAGVGGGEIAPPGLPPPPGGDTRPDFFTSLIQGGLASLREGHRLSEMAQGGSLADTPPETQPERGFFGRVGYGIGHSVPALAAGFLGGAAGSATPLGPIGGIIGSAGGFGIMSAAQQLAPAYDDAVRQGMPHDQALDFAIKSAAASGVIGAATAPIFAWMPFKSAVGNVLLHTFSTAPATSVVGTEAQALATDQPTPSLQQFGEAALEGTATGAALSGGHAVGRVIRQGMQPKPGPTITLSGAPEQPGPVPAGPGQLPPPEGSSPSAPPGTQVVPTAPPGPPAPAPAPALPVVPLPPPTPQPSPPAPAPPAPAPTPPPAPAPTPAPTEETGGQGLPIAPSPSPQPGVPDTGAGAPPVAPTTPDIPVSPSPAPDQGQVPATPVSSGPTPSQPPTPTPQTTPEGGPGTSREVATAVPGVSAPTTYEVVEAGSLKPATGELQPRDRATRAASEAQVAQIAGNLDPGQVSASPVADYGAPVVMPDGTVLAGNGRLAAIQRAAELHPEKYQAYRDALTALGHDVSNMQRPVLVRRTGAMTPEQARTFAEASNAPRAMTMSPVEQARVDARNLRDDTLDKYDPAKALTSPGNQGFIRDWMGSLPPTERARLVDEKGQLSAEGQRRLQGAVLAKAYGHDALLRRALEAPSDDVKSVTGTLTDVAAPWMKLRGETNAGRLPKELDVTQQLTEALDLIQQARDKGIAPGDIIKQGDMFSGPKLDPVTEQIVRTFYNDQMTRLRARTKMTEAFRDFVDQALSFRPGKDLFGNETQPDPAGMLRQAREGKQGGLLAAEQRIAEARPDEDLTPEEIADEEVASEEARDTTRAAQPENQARLEALNRQIDKLQTQIDTLRGKGAKLTGSDARKLAGAEKQQAALTKTRDQLLPPETLEKRSSNRFIRRAQGGRRGPPISPFNPKPFYAPRDIMDWMFNDGRTSVYHQAFADAGYDPHLAINKPLQEQVEILKRQTRKKFGLKDLTIDPSMDWLQSRQVLMDVYRASTDFLASLSYPADFLGIYGTVSLHLHPFDPRSGAAGGYVPSTKTINLPGTANSLGHEWTHALDHWLVDQLPQRLASLTVQARGTRALTASKTVLERFADVLNALSYDEVELAARKLQLSFEAAKTDAQGNPTVAARKAQQQLTMLQEGVLDKTLKPSEMRARSTQFGLGTREPGYWPAIFEMLARSHEAFIAREMENNGVDPRGVVMPDEAYTDTNDKQLRSVYPLNDRQRIFDAYVRLHEAIRNEHFLGIPTASFSDPAHTIDLKAITRLANKAPPGAARALRRAAMEMAAAMRHPVEAWRSVSFRDPTRPEASHPLGQRFRLGFHWWFSTKTGQLEVIQSMAPKGAQEPLQRIINMIGTQPGRGTNQPQTFEERAYSLARDWTRKFAAILENNHLTPRMLERDREANAMLRHALVTGEGTYQGNRIPSDIAKAAGEIRILHDAVFKANEDAGVNITYAKSGHLPRMYDHYAVWSDGPGFIRDATKLHKVMFEQDVGLPGDPEHPRNLLKRFQQLSQEERDLLPQSVRDDISELQKNLATQRRIIRELNDPASKKDPVPLQDRLDKLVIRADELATNLHDPIGDHIATLGAEEWEHRINVGYPDDFDTVGPSGNYLNHRVLPPEADTIMAKWMINDVPTILGRYYLAAARKQAAIEIFGGKTNKYPSNSKFEQALADAHAGGLRGDDLRLIRDLVEAVAGRANRSTPRLVRKASEAIHAFAAVTLLGKATLSMMPEPLVGGLSTGDMRVGLKTLAAQIRSIAQGADAKERAELADYLTVTVGSIYDDMMLNMAGNEYADTPGIRRAMGAYYRMNMMTQWNNSTRRASLAGHAWFLRKISNDWLTWKDWTGDKKGYNWARADTKGQRAEHWFNELNVFGNDERARREFAQFMVAHDGQPSIDTLEGPGNMMPVLAHHYAVAMNRLVNRAVQNVDKAGKPMTAEHPWLSLPLQFQTFLYGMQRNVLAPFGEKITGDTRRAYQRARGQGSGKFGAGAQATGAFAMSAGNGLATVGIYLAANMLSVLVGLALFAPDVLDDQMNKDNFWGYILSTAANRSGLGGILGFPVAQIDQLWYRHGINGLTDGPGMSNIMGQIQDIIVGLASGDEANTNTRYYNALKALYGLAIAPTEAMIMTKLAGGFGPIGNVLAWAANSFGTSRRAADWFAEQIVGPKGVERPKEDTDPYAAAERAYEAKPEGEAKEKETAGSGGAGQIAVGILDDFLSPTLKVGSALWSMAPPWARTAGKIVSSGVAAGLASWGGYNFWQDMADFRNAEPPEKKP